MKIPAWMVKLVGGLYLDKNPLWVVYQPDVHMVKGAEIRRILNVLKPGDIILRRFNRYVSSMFIPGFWTHACIYMGNDTITHAVGEGVCQEDILDFCRCDCVAVLRFKNLTPDLLNKVCASANEMVKEDIQYDYAFTDNNGTVYCTELVNICFNNAFIDDFSEVAGIHMIIPDHIYESKQVELILEVKHK